MAGSGRVTAAGDGGEPEVLTIPGVSRREPAAGAPVGAAVAGLGRFADRFCQAVLAPGRNGVFSPLSIGYAFAMLRAAAGGRTAAELDQVFGFPTSGVHEAYNALTRQLATTDTPPPVTKPGAVEEAQENLEDLEAQPPVVAIANGLFVQAGFRPSEAFLHTLAEQYGAPARAVDFRSGARAELINRWVSQQTAGRINSIFDSLDPGTVSVIANAIYLKASWEQPFPPTSRPEPFRRTDGSTVPVPMMRKHGGRFRYASGSGWQAVELPYAGGELAMWVLVPDGDQPPDRLLASDVLAAARDGARPENLDLALPRWDFSLRVELLPVLGDLGLAHLADLPGIGPGAAVSDARHLANITVDEWGTEAAAATAVVMRLSVTIPTVTVRADHPFAFAIVHPPTGTPLFLGQVADPTQS